MSSEGWHSFPAYMSVGSPGYAGTCFVSMLQMGPRALHPVPLARACPRHILPWRKCQRKRRAVPSFLQHAARLRQTPIGLAFLLRFPCPEQARVLPSTGKCTLPPVGGATKPQWIRRLSPYFYQLPVKKEGKGGKFCHMIWASGSSWQESVAVETMSVLAAGG